MLDVLRAISSIGVVAFGGSWLKFGSAAAKAVVIEPAVVIFDSHRLVRGLRDARSDDIVLAVRVIWHRAS